MAKDLNSIEPALALCQIAKDFHGRGWMYGTAGNLSVRTSDDWLLITASSKPKGQLQSNDFIEINLSTNETRDSGELNNKPSAETSIHQSIYQLYPNAKACLHVHSVDACIATEKFVNNDVALPNLEMIKGFNIWEQEPNIMLPVFKNHLHVPKIAEAISQRFTQEKPRIDALMIRDHGITVWADDLQTAYNRVEVLEFVMTYMAKLSPA